MSKTEDKYSEIYYNVQKSLPTMVCFNKKNNDKKCTRIINKLRLFALIVIRFINRPLQRKKEMTPLHISVKEMSINSRYEIWIKYKVGPGIHV